MEFNASIGKIVVDCTLFRARWSWNVLNVCRQTRDTTLIWVNLSHLFLRFEQNYFLVFIVVEQATPNLNEFRDVIRIYPLSAIVGDLLSRHHLHSKKNKRC